MDYNEKIELAKKNNIELSVPRAPQDELDEKLLAAELIEEKDTKAFADAEKVRKAEETKKAQELADAANAKNDEDEPAAPKVTLKKGEKIICGNDEKTIAFLVSLKAKDIKFTDYSVKFTLNKKRITETFGRDITSWANK